MKQGIMGYREYYKLSFFFQDDIIFLSESTRMHIYHDIIHFRYPQKRPFKLDLLNLQKLRTFRPLHSSNIIL